MAEQKQTTTFSTLARRANYAVQQASRVAWYSGQVVAMRRLVKRIEERSETKAPKVEKPEEGVPNERQLLAEVRKLFATDLKNVENGLYPMPENRASPMAMIRDARQFFADVPNVQRRRQTADHQQPFTQENREKLPRYYLQNFHFQSDGWLSEESADLYNNQVEVLFYGSAACMRRQGLVPFAQELKNKDQRKMAYADIATGCGNFLEDVKSAFPRLPSFAVDLSEPYLAKAQEAFKSRSKTQATVANAEHLPFADNSLDIASTVFLFHELPQKVRRIVIGEFARVLKPGGLLVFVDSLQTGDDDKLNGLLQLFPQMFHEPYYKNYLEDDIDGAFEDAGLKREYFAPAFVSRIAAFRKAV